MVDKKNRQGEPRWIKTRQGRTRVDEKYAEKKLGG